MRAIEISVEIEDVAYFTFKPIHPMLYCPYTQINRGRNVIPFSDTLLVLAPHQFSELLEPSRTTMSMNTAEMKNLTLDRPPTSQETANLLNKTDSILRTEDLLTDDNDPIIKNTHANQGEKKRVKNPEVTKNFPISRREDEEELALLTNKDNEEEIGSFKRYLVWLILLLLILSVLLCIAYRNHIFPSFDNRCHTIGLRMNWYEGPPPT